MKNHIFRLLLTAAAAITAETQGNGSEAKADESKPSAPAQPTTPEQLRDLKLAQAIEQKPSYATLLAVGLATLTGWITDGFIALGNKLKTEATELKSKAKPLGKMIAAAKVAYAQAQDRGDLSKDVTFLDYIYKLNGSKPQDTSSWNHAQSCAVVFAELVLTGRITEKDYDNRAADALAKACTVLNANKKNGGDLNSPVVAELIDVLLNSGDDERMEKLNKLKNKVQGKETVSKNGSGPVLDLANANALVKRVLEMDFDKVTGFGVVLDALTERIIGKDSTGKEIPRETREECLKRAMFKLTAALDSCGTAAQQESWVKDANANAETPGAAAPAELAKAA